MLLDIDDEEVSLADLSVVYSEHWLHIRHIENQRLIFTSIYLAAYGVGFGALLEGNVENQVFPSVLMLFLCAFSYIGFALSVKTMLSFWTHYLEIQRIQVILDPGSFKSYERSQRSIENYILQEEKGFRFLNKLFISLSKFGPISIPLTLLFPMLYLLGGLTSFVLMILFNLNPSLL